MPKAKKTKAQIIEDVLSKFNGDGSFRRDGDSAFCRRCLKRVNTVTLYTLKAHIATESHGRNAVRWKKLQTQLTTDEFVSVSGTGAQTTKQITANDFRTELTKAFIAADIPLHKLNNKPLKQIFAKYTHFSMPSAAMARSQIMPDIYQKMHKDLIEDLRGAKLWVSIDETRDTAGRFVAAIVVRKLNDVKSTPYILSVLQLDATNGSTIALAVDDALRELGGAIRRDDVLMLVTDGAPYMKCAGRFSLVILIKSAN